MVLLEDNYFLLEYYEQYNCIYYKSKGFTPSKLFRQNMEKVNKSLQAKKANIFISDLTDSAVISQEDQEWVISEFIQKMIPMGITNPIAIFPTSIFGKLSAQAIQKKIQENEELFPMIFNSKEEAFEWIKNQN